MVRANTSLIFGQIDVADSFCFAAYLKLLLLRDELRQTKSNELTAGQEILLKESTNVPPSKKSVLILSKVVK